MQESKQMWQRDFKIYIRILHLLVLFRNFTTDCSLISLLFRYSVEVLPIYLITAAAIGGAGWYISRLARGPDVVWDHKVSCYNRQKADSSWRKTLMYDLLSSSQGNPHPWQSIEPGTQTKLYSVNQKFDKQYKRERL